MSERYDAVFVGSGINSLVGAALLAQAGRRVLVLERNDSLGGAIKTAEITEPGFVHEVFSSLAPALPRLRGLCGARGRARRARSGVPEHRAADGLALPGRLERVPDHVPRGERGGFERLAPRGRRGLAARRRGVHAQRRPGVRRARHGALVVARRSASALKAYRRLGRRGLVEFSGDLLASCRDWVTETFSSPAACTGSSPRGSSTPGSGPDAASSGFMTQVIAVAIELGGMPVPRGGGVRLVEALAGIIRDAGGALRDRPRRRAHPRRERTGAGVAVAGGETVEAGRPSSPTSRRPSSTAGSLAGVSIPAEAAEAARRFRYGRAGCRSTWRSRSRRAGRATSGSGAPRSSTSRPASTASRGR